jgi:hypothetical protein
MPSTIKISVLSARNLPIMDRKSGQADAFVTIRIGKVAKEKTTVCLKNRNPVWNEDFRIEVADDGVLQDEPVEFKVLEAPFSYLHSLLLTGLCLLPIIFWPHRPCLVSPPIFLTFSTLPLRCGTRTFIAPTTPLVWCH